MSKPRAPSDFKLLETRKREGYTYRLYRNALGETRQTYEIGAPLATDAEIQGFLRGLKSRAAGRANMQPGPKPGHVFKRGVCIEPDRVDAILEDAANIELSVVEVCRKHGISTRTYYKILRGH